MVMVLRFWLIGMNEESPVTIGCFMPNLPKYRGLLRSSIVGLSLGKNAFFSQSQAA